MSIDSDAHAAAHFAFLSCGIAQARRGWAEKKRYHQCVARGEDAKVLIKH